METYFFFFFATLSIAAAIAMITSRDTVNSALFLVVNLVAVAGIFLLLKAQFLAVVQVLVYAGAIMVLFLFVIMLLNLNSEERFFSEFRLKYGIAFILSVLMLSLLVYAVADATNTLPVLSPDSAHIGTVEALGDTLFVTYILPVLSTAILLTAAVVGALMLAQRKNSSNKES